ncbi:MAG: ABC transporter ATP-binding protein [Armatimonadota bacterium]|nr:ABC transporter ATP-binding protein [Armatimonadota bacterium]
MSKPIYQDPPLVQMVGITKRFPGVVANDRVSFEVRRGEIHALLGENGAGKSTLMKILYGFYRPDEGEIYLDGRRVVFRSPRDAIAHGIGMVFQHFTLVPSLSVMENLLMGMDSCPFVLRQDLARRIEELSRRYGLQVDPRAKVWQLSVGEQQRVEVLKLLYREARILILDEPTSVLTPLEVRNLFSTLRQLASEGRSIVLITHKLDEVMALADRITVLRAGRVVGTLERAQATKEELARMMVGRETSLQTTRDPVPPGPVVLEVENLQARNDRGLPALRGISFEVRAGEIFGIGGVAGNGQRELGEVIMGLRPATSGRVRILGRDVTNRSPTEILRYGVSYIPEDRLKMGVAPGLSVRENLLLRYYNTPPYCRGPLLDFAAARSLADHLIAQFGILVPDREVPVRFLSGGNLQRLILAREIHIAPRLIVAFHPTRGLDVAATEATHRILMDQRKAGTAILLISEDLDEILTLSDRIGVMHEGEIVGVFPREGVDLEEIALLMAGERRIPARVF